MTSNPYLTHKNDPELSKQQFRLSRRKNLILEHKRQRSPPPKLISNPTYAIFGNYHNYYKVRTSEYKVDSRLLDFDSEWFENKRLLDVGCNAGKVSIDCWKLWKCDVTGVDIDPVVIAKARYQASIQQSLAKGNIPDYFPLSAPLQLGTRPTNLHFRCSDWVHEEVDEKFDIILALSISKWIQLNNGDGGLRYFFQKVYKSLFDGGIFILENQHYKGYRKRAGMSQKMLKNYNEMEFFPDEHEKYLIGIGFSVVKRIPKKNKGFERPIIVFKK